MPDSIVCAYPPAADRKYDAPRAPAGEFTFPA